MRSSYIRENNNAFHLISALAQQVNKSPYLLSFMIQFTWFWH